MFWDLVVKPSGCGTFTMGSLQNQNEFLMEIRLWERAWRFRGDASRRLGFCKESEIQVVLA